MNQLLRLAVATGLSALLAAPVLAGGPLANTTSASGPFAGSIATLNDGVIPPLGQNYTIDTVYNFGDTTFTFDFGGVVTITDVLASVDNNDDYRIDFFNGANFVISFFIPASEGSVQPNPGGMDLFASFPVCCGGTQLGTSALFQASTAVIHGLAGDGLYGIGEVQFFDNSAVPEPASWAMMIGGFAVLGGVLRRRPARISLA